MKKIFLISLLIITIVSLSAVCAEQNLTDTTQISDDNIIEINEDDNIQTDSQKEDLNVTIEYVDYIIRPTDTDDELFLSFKNVPDDYTKNVPVYVDDNLVYAMSPHETKEAYFTNYGYGQHILKVVFSETDKYNPLTLTHTFEMTTGAITITESFNTGEGWASIHMQPGATGNFVVKVDGKAFKTVKIDTSQDSTAHVSLSSLKVGTHVVEASYAGDENNPKMYKKKSVTVFNDIDVLDNYYEFKTMRYANPANHIWIAFPESIAKDPIFMINGSEMKFDKEDETYTVNLSALLPGNYILNVTYPGDGQFPKKSFIYPLTVIACFNLDNQIYNSSFISLELPGDGEGNVTVYVNDEFYKTKAAGKYTTVDLDNLKVGVSYRVKAVYSANDYDVENFTRTVELVPNFSCTSPVKIGEDVTVSVLMDSDKKGTIYLDMRAGHFEIELVNGSGSVTISGLDITKDEDGIYTNEVYLSSNITGYHYSKLFDIFVQPLKAELVNSKDITMYYGESKTYSVKLYNHYGNAVADELVTIKIGSKKYPVLTDKNGIAKLKIPSTPGTYKIEASYKKYESYPQYVNDKYVDTKAVATNKLVVKQPLKLKTVTVKKSAQKLVLTATLKSTKVIKNKKITFKFNGKKYTAKTNSKGTAKVTVKSGVLKKLKVGKKITYQATYLKDTVKKTAKVKK